jgi:carboxypeptidase Q
MKKIVVMAGFLAAGVASYAQQDDSSMIRKISNEILANGRAYENLRQLTKQIGARLTASPQMYKAEAWGLKIMQESGADKIYFQECTVPHWVRGGPEKAIANFANSKTEKKLDILGLGNSMGTGPDGVNAPVVEVRSFEDLETKKDQVKGKIVFYNYKFNPTFVNTFQSYGDAVRYRGGGPSAAA